MEIRGTAASGYASKSSVACRSAQLARSFCTCHRRVQSRRLEAGFCDQLNGKWLATCGDRVGGQCVCTGLVDGTMSITCVQVNSRTYIRRN